MGETIRFRTDAGEHDAYLAVPDGRPGPGVVVVQEWWGLVDHIRDVCDRFAAEGFVAIAPDLYRGETTDEPDEAGRRMQELEVEAAALELSGAIGYLLQHDAVAGEQVGVVGYCMGGALALVAGEKAAGKVGAVDSYYGVFWYGDTEFHDLDCPVVLRVGTEDAYISVEKVEELAEHIRSGTGADVRTATYDGAGHAFSNDTRESYAPDAARAAWDDTVAFLRGALR